MLAHATAYTMLHSSNKNQVQCQMYQTFAATKATQLANKGRLNDPHRSFPTQNIL